MRSHPFTAVLLVCYFGMHLNNKVLETHLSTPISQTFALIAGDCNTTAFSIQLRYNACWMLADPAPPRGP